MRLLLDSHILLRWDAELHKLSAAQRSAISDPYNQVFVSAVSSWELGIKAASGKLVLRDSIRNMVQSFGFSELAITLPHGEAAASLPLFHKDPFDRMLVAQAIVEGMVLVTADGRLKEYAVAML